MALNNNLINIIQQPPQGPLVVSNNFYNIGTPLEDLVVDADIIDSVLEDEKTRQKKIIEVEKILRLRLGEHAGDPNYKQFAEKLGELREKMGRSLSLV